MTAPHPLRWILNIGKASSPACWRGSPSTRILPRIAAGMGADVAGGCLVDGFALLLSGSSDRLRSVEACLGGQSTITERRFSIKRRPWSACIKGLIAGPISVAMALRYARTLHAVHAASPSGACSASGLRLAPTLFVLALRISVTRETGRVTLRSLHFFGAAWRWTWAP